MAYRIVRSPERRAFYIDVGNIPPQDVEQYMQKVMTSMKRNQVVDPSTGRVDLRYNPLSVEEDYFIPVRGNSSTKIEPVAGGKGLRIAARLAADKEGDLAEFGFGFGGPDSPPACGRG